MIPGDTYDTTIVLRSIDYVEHKMTIEDLECQNPFQRFIRVNWFRTLPIDHDYVKEILGNEIEWAKHRSTGRAKVSKRCVKRLEAQLQAAAGN